MRVHVDYANARRERGAAGIADDYVAGFYRFRRSAGAVYRPVAVWFGPPLDPIDHTPLDRSPRWQILYCGRFIWNHELVWPVAAGEPIDRDEYEYLLARVAHAQEHDPRDPFGTGSGRINWLTATPP